MKINLSLFDWLKTHYGENKENLTLLTCLTQSLIRHQSNVISIKELPKVFITKRIRVKELFQELENLKLIILGKTANNIFPFVLNKTLINRITK